MNYNELESRLRQIPLTQPDPEVKRRLLRQAAGRLRAQRRGRALGWACAAAAGVLIVINLIFGQAHEHRLAALTGRPAVAQSQAGAAYAQTLSQREQMLQDILGPNGS